MEEGASPENGGGGGVGRSPELAAERGRSCKGCLYYSSVLKSSGYNPVCLGITRSLPRVPSHIVGESETEVIKEGRDLSDFKYACVGYSMFLDKKDISKGKQEDQAELPFCVGIEVLVDRKTSAAGHASAHAHKECSTFSQPRGYRFLDKAGEEFLGRFQRSAGLVASGVARNINKMANYIKEHIDDIFYPYRRRPK